MLTIRELIKTLYNAFNQKLKNHRGNWEQNDPTADDYIKNRPFYTDDSKKVVIVPNQQITFSDNGARLTLSEIIEFVVGQSYEVKWDDVNYTCVAWDLDGSSAIGNQGMIGGPIDTGEPFIIMILKAEGVGVIRGLTATGTHTVEVTTSTKIVKIDKKYLPDDLITDLAPVATSGSYNDLTDTPTIYADVVRYGTSQNLTTAQKTQARTNIGAGTSSFSGSYNDLTDIIVGKTYTYQSITINKIRMSTYTTIPDNVKFEQITYQTTWKVDWGPSTSTFSLKLDKISRESNYYKYSSSSNSSYGLNVYDDRKIRCFAPTGVYYVDVTFDSIAVSTDIQLDERYIPDTIQRVADMPTDYVTYTAQVLTEEQQKQVRTNIGAGTSNYNDLINTPIIDNTLTISGAVADAKAVGDAVTQLTEQKADKSELEKLNTPKNYIILIDQVSGVKYRIAMRDGSIVSYVHIEGITVTSAPAKTTYMAGEYFDSTGLVISTVSSDGSTVEVSDFVVDETYANTYLTEDVTEISVSYTDESDEVYTTTVPITVTPFNPAAVLVDFEYTANDDGTYTITGWKGTYNGEASTEMIIPNNGLIIV